MAAALKLSFKPLSGLAYLVVINLGLMLAGACVSNAYQLSLWHPRSKILKYERIQSKKKSADDYGHSRRLRLSVFVSTVVKLGSDNATRHVRRKTPSNHMNLVARVLKSVSNIIYGFLRQIEGVMARETVNYLRAGLYPHIADLQKFSILRIHYKLRSQQR